MEAHYLVQLIFVLTGVVAMLAAALDWDWFFTARNTLWAVKSVGRRRARLYYFLLGLMLVAAAIWFYFNIPRT